MSEDTRGEGGCAKCGVALATARVCPSCGAATSISPWLQGGAPALRFSHAGPPGGLGAAQVQLPLDPLQVWEVALATKHQNQRLALGASVASDVFVAVSIAWAYTHPTDRPHSMYGLPAFACGVSSVAALAMARGRYSRLWSIWALLGWPLALVILLLLPDKNLIGPRPDGRHAPPLPTHD